MWAVRDVSGVGAARLAIGPDAPGETLGVAARVALALKEPAAAVQHARQAVELSSGEDASAQGALAAALRATGDRAGASAALKKAADLDPANPEYRVATPEKPKKKAVKAS